MNKPTLSARQVVSAHKLVSHLRISTRLYGTFLASVLMMFLMAGASYVIQLRGTELTSRIVGEDLQLQDEFAAWERAVEATNRVIGVMYNPKGQAFYDEFLPQLESLSAAVDASFKRIRKVAVSPAEVAIIKNLDDQNAALEDISRLMESARAAGDVVAMQTIYTERLMPELQKYAAEKRRLVEVARQEMRVRVDAELKAQSALLLTVALGVAAGTAVLAFFELAVVREVGRSLDEAVSVARRVSRGDLNVSVESSGQDELSSLKRSLSAMAASLREVVASVRTNALGIAEASRQIAAGNQDLSARTEAQAGRLEAATSSMNEIVLAARSTAEGARQAYDHVQRAGHLADRGKAAVEDAVLTMQSIESASQKVSEITGVINAIAFQTNVLALNASVEAARAGDHGRGFSVVAEEVRTLAQRAGDAAKEIKGLIDRTVSSIEQGSVRVRTAGRAIEDVVSSAAAINGLIERINQAAGEQIVAVDAISSSMSHLDKATQQNAALVEEAAAASESMSQMAEGLLSSMSVFKTN